MFHNESRHLLVQAFDKTHNSRELQKCFPLIAVRFIALLNDSIEKAMWLYVPQSTLSEKFSQG